MEAGTDGFAPKMLPVFPKKAKGDDDEALVAGGAYREAGIP